MPCVFNNGIDCSGSEYNTPEGARCLTAALQHVVDQYRSLDILAARMRARDRAVMGRSGTAEGPIVARPAMTPMPSGRVRRGLGVY